MTLVCSRFLLTCPLRHNDKCLFRDGAETVVAPQLPLLDKVVDVAVSCSDKFLQFLLLSADTEEVSWCMVYGMVSLITSSHDLLWRAMLSCSLSISVAGDWLRFPASERVRLLRLPREACFDEFR